MTSSPYTVWNVTPAVFASRNFNMMMTTAAAITRQAEHPAAENMTLVSAKTSFGIQLPTVRGNMNQAVRIAAENTMTVPCVRNVW